MKTHEGLPHFGTMKWRNKKTLLKLLQGQKKVRKDYYKNIWGKVMEKHRIKMRLILTNGKDEKERPPAYNKGNHSKLSTCKENICT
jgi:hypothetical protein